MAEEHDPGCRWPSRWPCLRFSTDGTVLGARIAHMMGTTDEDEIARMGQDRLRHWESDIAAEQADWESDEHEDA